jgi:hypothetical protein
MIGLWLLEGGGALANAQPLCKFLNAPRQIVDRMFCESRDFRDEEVSLRQQTP